MPNEARNLGLHRADDQLHILGSGFGGSAVGTREYVSIDMRDSGAGEYRFGLNVDIPRGDSILPSVLGRDVLNRGRLTCDPMNNVLDFDIWSADDFVPR